MGEPSYLGGVWCIFEGEICKTFNYCSLFLKGNNFIGHIWEFISVLPVMEFCRLIFGLMKIGLGMLLMLKFWLLMSFIRVCMVSPTLDWERNLRKSSFMVFLKLFLFYLDFLFCQSESDVVSVGRGFVVFFLVKF